MVSVMMFIFSSLQGKLCDMTAVPVYSHDFGKHVSYDTNSFRRKERDVLAFLMGEKASRIETSADLRLENVCGHSCASFCLAAII